jgi:hypothetical protein
MSRTRSALAALSLTAAAAVLGMPAAHAAAAPGVTTEGQSGVVASYCSHHPENCHHPRGGVGAGEGGSLVSMSPAELGAGATLAVVGVGGAVIAWRRRSPAMNLA